MIFLAAMIKLENVAVKTVLFEIKGLVKMCLKKRRTRVHFAESLRWGRIASERQRI